MSALAHQAQTGAGGTGDTVHIQRTPSTSRGCCPHLLSHLKTLLQSFFEKATAFREMPSESTPPPPRGQTISISDTSATLACEDGQT